MKRVIICADDYAIAPGVSQAIRALIADRRLNATSVMTVADPLAREAEALLEVVDGDAVSVGLHVTLTGTFAPLTPYPTGDAGTFGTLSSVMGAAFTHRLPLKALVAEVEAQFLAFREAFGRPPAHVDGHQHVHLLPTVRRVVLDAARRHAPNAWVRDCTPAPKALNGFDMKGRIIGLLATGLSDAAARRGLSTNTGFAGAYDFGADHDFAHLLRHFLAGLPDGGLVMVHPGRVDDPLTARDPLTHQREVEYSVLAGEGFLEILADVQAHL